MTYSYLKIVLSTCMLISASIANAQTDDVLNLLINKNVISQNDADSMRAEAAIQGQQKHVDKVFSIDLEFRPRTEYRQGYGQMSNDTTASAFYTNQRTRISFGYQILDKLNFQFSIQDIRTFGKDDPRTNAGTIQVFEAYLEPYITKNFSIRVGRQRLMYDNQRLFAQNDWRQNANAHDGINFRYINTKFKTELAGVWNQSAEATAGTGFFPVDQTGKPIVNYKLLVVNYLNWNINKQFTLTTINCADGFQAPTNVEKLYTRFTNGGRIEFEHESIYATFSAYYQHGKNNTGQKLNAFYIQPELKYLHKNTTVRLGAEIMSGQDATKTSNEANSFVPLYGVAHRFNGFMDLYTRFPGDLNYAGLVNPYLFIIQNISKKVNVGFFFHQFYSQNNFVDSDNNVIDKNLGFEHDILFQYKPNNFTTLEVGYSYYLPTESTAIIKKAKVGAEKEWQQWAYVMLIVKPQLFKHKFN
ncbi:MAG: alginate export family protein [Bacteroidia bacterium]|nr:alginate export family protein [Bacteroidia bacterium]HQV00154.1 alginate export family protein [Bacteroidia bacterium]